MGGFGDGKFTSAPPPRRVARDRRLKITAFVLTVLPCVIVFPSVRAAMGVWGSASALIVSFTVSSVLTLTSRSPTHDFVVDADGIAVGEVRHPWSAIADVRVDGDKLYAEADGDRLELCRLAWVRPGPAELFAAIERHSAGRFRPR